MVVVRIQLSKFLPIPYPAHIYGVVPLFLQKILSNTPGLGFCSIDLIIYHTGGK